MAAAAAAATDAGHKVRGGSALSLALARASPQLLTSSPVDSTSSAALSTPNGGGGPLAWLSSSSGSTQPASPPEGGASLVQDAAAPQQQEQQQEQQQQQQPQQQQQQRQELDAAPGVVPPPGAPPHSHSSRPRLFPFSLGACFGAGSLPTEGSVRGQQQLAVSAAEVGIRPCFYWLEAHQVSDEERLFAEANARWLKSDCQDDAVVIEHFGGLRHQTFAGVFDGHGPYGRAAAKFASTRLPQLLAAKAGGVGASERKRLRALREAFLDVNAAMQDVAQAGFDASLSGTTACCVLVCGHKVLVASTGDSRCVVARRRAGLGAGGPGEAGDIEVVPLTWDAKPSLPEEERRIEQHGGVVKQLLDERGERVGAYRVFCRGDDVLPGLAMSRSLGDLYAHEVGVSAEPVLKTYTLGERDLFLLLATDGLWDIMGNEEAADFVERYKTARDLHVTCAEALTLEAQERWKALHNEAIVDDISCVILHTAGLPPPDRGSSVPRPLARAASCNDEANELYLRWREEKQRNPSNHRPKQYFKHLYGDEEGGAEEAAAAAAGAQEQQGQEAAAASAAPAPAPPASPLLLRDAPRRGLASSSGSAGSLVGPPPASLRSPSRISGSRSPTALGGMGGSSGALHRMDDISSQSPHSSYGDLGSENSEPSTRRGAAFAVGSWGAELSAAAELARRSSVPQPIPSRNHGGCGADGVPMSLPLESLLRPVRKAFPSTNNLNSFRSDASLVASDTPRSGDGGLAAADLERKVRGGMSRSLSHAACISSPLHYSLPAHHSASHASLAAWERGGGMGGRRGSRLDERVQSSSSLGSPGSEAMLMSPSLPTSPHQSPHVVPLGGYSRLVVQPQPPSLGGGSVQQSPQAALTRVQSIPPLEGVPELQPRVAAARLALRAEAVQHGVHLSRTTTDTASLVAAMVTLASAEAAATDAPPSP